MVIFPLVNGEAWLVCLESDTVPDLSTKKHPWALHKVVHDVLEFWHQSFLVDKVEVNLLISRNLEPNITFNEIDCTSCFWDVIILVPVVCFWVNLIQWYWTWWPGDECLVKQQKHVSQVIVGNLLTSPLGHVIWINCISVTLSVENVDLIHYSTVESLDGKVSISTVCNCTWDDITIQLFIVQVIDEMILLFLDSMVGCDEKLVIW